MNFIRISSLRLGFLLLTFIFCTPFTSTGQTSGTSQPESRESSLQATLRYSSVIYDVHLTGEIPYTGMKRVPPGTRVDELIVISHEAWIFRENQIGVPSESEEGQQWLIDQPEDALSDILNSDLDLRNIRILKRDGSIQLADLIGYRLGGNLDDNPILEQGDVVNIRKLSANPFVVSVSGAVKTPLTIPYQKNDTAERLLNIAGGRSSEASLEEILIYRIASNAAAASLSSASSSKDQRSARGHSSFETFTLTTSDLALFTLEPGDRIVVPVDQSKRNIHQVTIQGEVNRPGTYPISEGVTTLQELVEMAGGPTSQALLHGIEIVRHSDDELDNELAENRYRPLPMLFRVSDQYEESRAQLELEIQTENNVIFADLSHYKRETQSEENLFNASSSIPLFHEDEITIPKDQKTIRVMGQIGVPGFYVFDPKQDFREYIQQAGGFSPAADTNRIYVIKAATRNWVPIVETTLSSGDILFVDREPLVSYRAAEDLELRKADMQLRRESQDTNDRRTNVQIGVSLINATVSIITTYLLIRRQ